MEHQPEGNFFNKYEDSNPITKKIMNNFFDKLSDLINDLNLDYIFDAGCGEGYVTSFIHRLKPHCSVSGMDISEKVIKLASDKYPDIAFAVGSIYQIKQPDASHDLVVACEVLEHLERPLDALVELFRVSKRYVLLSVPREPIWRISNMARLKYWRHMGNTPGHIQHFSKKDFVALAEKMGHIRQIRTPFPWTMLLCEK